jgi:DNA-binding phage protein
MRRDNMDEEKVIFENWDLADDVETKEDVIRIIEAAAEEDDPEFLLSVIGILPVPRVWPSLPGN